MTPAKIKVRAIIEALAKAQRQGADVDEPEGARYVVISETLLNILVTHLQQVEESL